jgi:DDE superfamily endonuclease
VPAGLAIHLIVDNYATHKHAKVWAWLDKRPRFKVHFTPTGSSWLNLVERFFADLTGDVIRSAASGRLKSWCAISMPISPAATPLPSLIVGRPKAQRSSPRSTAHAPPSTMPRRLCEDF